MDGGGDFGGHGGDSGHSGSDFGSHSSHDHGCSGHDTHQSHSDDAQFAWFAWMWGVPTGLESPMRRGSPLKRKMRTARRVIFLVIAVLVTALAALVIPAL